MADWRDTILENFQKHIARLMLVADPDGLLAEERMLAAIKDRGFELIPFVDPVAFRFAYESQYRSLWDQGAKTDLVVVLRSAQQRLDSLPHDLLQAGRRLEFALHKIFPKLSYPVLASVDRSHLDAIHEAYQQHDGDTLTERETKEFVLMHCFGIVPKLIKTPVELLKMLLSLHSRQVRLPTILSEYLIENLEKEKSVKKWPLAEILPSRESFLRFLQGERTKFWALSMMGKLSHDTRRKTRAQCRRNDRCHDQRPERDHRLERISPRRPWLPHPANRRRFKRPDGPRC